MSTPNALSTSRRRFIKTFALGSASAMIDGALWRARLLADISTAQSRDILPVRLSAFPVLKNQFGSVRLKLIPVEGDMPVGFFYPIVITRGAGNTFYALNSNCSHQACVVNAYSTAQGGMVCPCHGSKYAIDGSLINGPATFPLGQFNLSYDGADVVRVEVPGIHVEMLQVATVAGPGGAARVKLGFQTFFNGQYKIVFHQRLTDTPQNVAFSTTAGGAATETMIMGYGDPITVYVDATSDTGFYSSELVVTPG